MLLSAVWRCPVSASGDVLGLDKLAFYLSPSDIEFRPEFAASIRRADVNSATGEIGRESELWRPRVRVRGRTRELAPVSGSLAFLNTPDYQFTVKPDGKTGTAFCMVQFSSGAFEETNLLPLDRDGAAEIALKVQRDLAERGAALDLDRAKLVRLDVANNVILDDPVDAYAPLFSGVGARKRVSKQDFGGTGFLVGNTRWQLALYDKGAQMRAKGLEGALCPVNTLRPELRLMKAPVIRERLGLTACTLPELRSKWSALRPAYDEALRSEIFRHSGEANKPALFDFDACAVFALESGGRRAWERFKSYSALGALVTQMGLPAAKRLVSRHFAPGATEVEKRQRLRYAEQLDAVAFRLSLDGSVSSGRSLLTLYQELESKLLAVGER